MAGCGARPPDPAVRRGPSRPRGTRTPCPPDCIRPRRRLAPGSVPARPLVAAGPRSWRGPGAAKDHIKQDRTARIAPGFAGRVMIGIWRFRPHAYLMAMRVRGSNHLTGRYRAGSGVVLEATQGFSGEPRDLRDAGQGKSEDAPAEWTAKRDLVDLKSLSRRPRVGVPLDPVQEIWADCPKASLRTTDLRPIRRGRALSRW